MKIPIKLLFIIAALYDAILGIIFLFAPGRVFEAYDVTSPNHPGYVQFPAALLLIFALMFAVIAHNPLANRRLIPYGILLKISYCGIVFYHWFNNGIPDMWKPFAIADLIFLVLFAAALVALRIHIPTYSETYRNQSRQGIGKA